MKIAAFVDAEGNTLPFDSSGMIYIYEMKNSGQWLCVCKVPLYINRNMNLVDIRKSIYTIASDLAGCKAFIIKRSMGIFNTIFEEELHIRVFSATGSPLAVLDQVRELVRTEIIEAIKKAELCKQQNNETSPIAVGDLSKGCYLINLVKVQEKNESMNSKDILLPFFQNNKFMELEIICLHTPKWIERELGNFNYKVKTEIRKDGFCHAFVYPAG